MIFAELNGVDSECRSISSPTEARRSPAPPGAPTCPPATRKRSGVRTAGAHASRCDRALARARIRAARLLHHRRGAAQNQHLLLPREKFVELMNEPRPIKPLRMKEALAYNTTPA